MCMRHLKLGSNVHLLHFYKIDELEKNNLERQKYNLRISKKRTVLGTCDYNLPANYISQIRELKTTLILHKITC